MKENKEIKMKCTRFGNLLTKNPTIKIFCDMVQFCQSDLKTEAEILSETYLSTKLHGVTSQKIVTYLTKVPHYIHQRLSERWDATLTQATTPSSKRSSSHLLGCFVTYPAETASLNKVRLNTSYPHFIGKSWLPHRGRILEIRPVTYPDGHWQTICVFPPIFSFNCKYRRIDVLTCVETSTWCSAEAEEVSFGPRLPRDPPRDPGTITETAVKITQIGNSTVCRHNKVIPGVRFVRKVSRLSWAHRWGSILRCYRSQYPSASQTGSQQHSLSL
jgi:hypothetical protein